MTAVRDEHGCVLCHHGRPIQCNECGEEYAADLERPVAASRPRPQDERYERLKEAVLTYVPEASRPDWPDERVILLAECHAEDSQMVDEIVDRTNGAASPPPQEPDPMTRLRTLVQDLQRWYDSQPCTDSKVDWLALYDLIGRAGRSRPPADPDREK